MLALSRWWTKAVSLRCFVSYLMLLKNIFHMYIHIICFPITFLVFNRITWLQNCKRKHDPQTFSLTKSSHIARSGLFVWSESSDILCKSSFNFRISESYCSCNSMRSFSNSARVFSSSSVWSSPSMDNSLACSSSSFKCSENENQSNIISFYKLSCLQ